MRHSFLVFFLAATAFAAPHYKFDVTTGKRVQFSAAEESAWSAANSPAIQLARAKAAKRAAVVARTDELLNETGVQYGGNWYLPTDKNRSDWWILYQQAKAGELAYPVTISTKDDGEVSFANASGAKNWKDAIFAQVKSWEDTERGLRIAIKAAADVAAVNAIIDPR